MIGTYCVLSHNSTSPFRYHDNTASRIKKDISGNFIIPIFSNIENL